MLFSQMRENNVLLLKELIIIYEWGKIISRAGDLDRIGF